MRTTKFLHLTSNALCLLGITTGATGQRCGDGHDSLPTLGIRTYYCRGGSCRIDGASAVVAPAEKRNLPYRFDFSVEPSLWDVDDDGPSGGKLQDGDVLVAIDHRGVTTVEGSRALEELAVGMATVLTIRRDGRLLDVSVVPVASCDRMTIAAGSAASPSGMTLTWRQPVDQLLRRRSRSMVRGIALEAWGVVLACSRCREVGGPQGNLVWQFDERPVVVSVTEGGPASAAGLRLGDIITHIDDDDVLTATGANHLRGSDTRRSYELRYLRGDAAQHLTIRTGGRE